MTHPPLPLLPPVPCSGASGCTYTQGYWKNHHDAGDWPVTTLQLGTASYSQSQLLDILRQSVGGNGLISLAHQLIAAKLNQAKGATPAPSSAIAQADALIGGRVVPPVGSGTLATSATSALVSTLDDYNNGDQAGGPPHCGDEQEESPEPSPLPSPVPSPSVNVPNRCCRMAMCRHPAAPQTAALAHRL